MKEKKVFKFNKLHLWTLVARYTRQTICNFKSIVMLVLQMPLMLCLIALIYKENTFIDPYLIFDATTLMFIFVIISCFMALLNSYREITKERDVLKREVAGGLDIVSYVISKFIVLTGIVFVQSLILTLGSLTFIDFAFDNFLTGYLVYFFSVFLAGVCSTAIGLLISAVIKRSENAVLPVLLVLIAFLLFSGTLFDFDSPTDKLLYVSPMYWALSMFGNTLGFIHKPMFVDNPVLLCVAILVLFTMVFYLITVIVLKRRTKRSSI